MFSICLSRRQASKARRVAVKRGDASSSSRPRLQPFQSGSVAIATTAMSAGVELRNVGRVVTASDIVAVHFPSVHAEC